jgi:hydroxypyruvate isomerase
MKRRDFLTTAAALASAPLARGTVSAQAPAQATAPAVAPVARKGRIKQGAMRFNFAPGTSFDEMCRQAASLGLVGFDITGPKDWPTLKKYGLISTVSILGPLTQEDGMVRKELHDALEPGVRAAIDAVAAEGYPNLGVLGGQRKGLSYEEGADNLVAFLNRVKGQAEDKHVTLLLEMVNSKYEDPNLGRKDSVCDHLKFTVDVIKRVNSPRVKLVFDAYHVAIMDGDVAANLRENIQHVSHFHTAGVPGRGPIDETQELNYRFLAHTLVELGFTGYVVHEYRPSKGGDPLKELARAIEIMDV